MGVKLGLSYLQKNVRGFENKIFGPKREQRNAR
jgi:hypothetical protein